MHEKTKTESPKALIGAVYQTLNRRRLRSRHASVDAVSHQPSCASTGRQTGRQAGRQADRLRDQRTDLGYGLIKRLGLLGHTVTAVVSRNQGSPTLSLPEPSQRDSPCPSQTRL